MRHPCHRNTTQSFLQQFRIPNAHPQRLRLSLQGYGLGPRGHMMREMRRITQRNFTPFSRVTKGHLEKYLESFLETRLETFPLTLCFSLCCSPAEPYVRHPGAHTKWSHPWLAVQHGGQNPIQLRVRFCIGRTQYPHMYCVTWQRSTVGLPVTVLQRCDFLSFFHYLSVSFFLSVLLSVIFLSKR